MTPGGGPQKFLGDWEGCLQADAFAGYEAFYATGRVRQVSCWAHARRKFFEAKESSPRAHEALAFIARLYAVEKKLTAIRPEPQPLDKQGEFEREVMRWHRVRRDARQQHSLPILRDFRAWLRKIDALPKSPLGGAVQYVLSRWESFERYCEKGFLAIDNNLAERMVRPLAIGRKNYLFLGADRGGHAAAVWYSLVATAKANQLEPWAWCKAILERLTDQGDAPSREELLPMLPQAWLQQRPDARRKYAR